MTLPLHAGPELSVAATKSYIASLAALLHLVARWADDAALLDALDASPALLRDAWQLRLVGDGRPALPARASLYVIGRGLGFGIAQEAALKFKETCGLHAEAFSAAEVRHGPMALVGPDFPLLVFRQGDETADGVDELVARCARARRRRAGRRADRSPGAIAAAARSPAHPAIEPMLQIQSFYRAANALSLRARLSIPTGRRTWPR